MPSRDGPVGYVLKRYPRLSETFILRELIAHEQAGLPLEIFSLGPPEDGPFQDGIGRVRAPVRYLTAHGVKPSAYWQAIEEALGRPWFRADRLRAAVGCDPRRVYQALRLAVAARDRGVRHLHAHFASAATEVARLASAWTGIPFTFTAHAKDLFHDDVDPDDLERKLAQAAAVVTVSDYNAAFLARNHGAAAAGVVRIDNGLDLESLTFIAGPRPPRVVAVGRLVPKKGFAHLIEAMAKLRSRGSNVACDLVGGGPEERPLRALVAKLGLEATVHLHGALPQTETLRLVADAGVLAAPCRVADDGDRDGLPTVLLEAMALGTPCVATPVTGIPELIEHGRSGLLVPEADPAALAGALQRILADPALGRQVARAARRRIEERFDVRRTSRALRAVFARSRERRTGS